MFALALPQGSAANRQDGGVGSYGVLAPSSSSLVLCHASPTWQCQQVTGTLCLWHRGHPGRHTPSGTPRPALGAPQHPRLPCLARAVTGAAALDAFAVSPGGSLEKSSVLGTRIPEPRKTAALRSRFPGCADEINTARCRALCPPGRPPLPSPERGN